MKLIVMIMANVVINPRYYGLASDADPENVASVVEDDLNNNPDAFHNMKTMAGPFEETDIDITVKPDEGFRRFTDGNSEGIFVPEHALTVYSDNGEPRKLTVAQLARIKAAIFANDPIITTRAEFEEFLADRQFLDYSNGTWQKAEMRVTITSDTHAIIQVAHAAEWLMINTPFPFTAAIDAIDNMRIA